MGEFDNVPNTNVVEPSPEATPGPREPCVTVLSGPQAGASAPVTPGGFTLGRDPECGLQIVDDGVSRVHARIDLADSRVYLVDEGSTNGTFVNNERISEHALVDGDRLQLGANTVVKFHLVDEVERDFAQQQFDAARRDGLTGCYNKSHLVEHLDIEFSFAKRHKRTLSLAMIDADHFKKVNDTWGHLAGDAVLKQLAGIIRSCIRTEDLVARYGGEEFTVVMRETDLARAQVVAERIRTTVNAAPLRYEATPIPVTVSIGLAMGPSATVQTPESLVQVADDALYRAKSHGRDRVMLAPEVPPPR